MEIFIRGKERNRQKYTKRSKVPIFASMTVVNFTVLSEPQK